MQLPHAFQLTTLDGAKAVADPAKGDRNAAMTASDKTVKGVQFSTIFADLKVGDLKIEYSSNASNKTEHGDDDLDQTLKPTQEPPMEGVEPKARKVRESEAPDNDEPTVEESSPVEFHKVETPHQPVGETRQPINRKPARTTLESMISPRLQITPTFDEVKQHIPQNGAENPIILSANTSLSRDIKIPFIPVGDPQFDRQPVVKTGHSVDHQISPILAFETSPYETKIELRELEEASGRPVEQATMRANSVRPDPISDDATPKNFQFAADIPLNHERHSNQQQTPNKLPAQAANLDRQSAQVLSASDGFFSADQSRHSTSKMINRPPETLPVTTPKHLPSGSPSQTTVQKPAQVLPSNSTTNQSSEAGIVSELPIEASVEIAPILQRTGKNTSDPGIPRSISEITRLPQSPTAIPHLQIAPPAVSPSAETQMLMKTRRFPTDQKQSEHTDTPHTQKRAMEPVPLSHPTTKTATMQTGYASTPFSQQMGIVFQTRSKAERAELEGGLLDPKALDELGMSQSSEQIRTANTATVQSLTKADLPSHIPRQLADLVSNSNGKSVEIALSPEELGRVKMSITQAENGVIVNIFAERPDTLDLLRRHIDQLNQELKLLGYQSPEFSFSNEGEGSSPEKNATPQDQTSPNDNPSNSTAPSLTQERSTLQAQAGLDIRI